MLFGKQISQEHLNLLWLFCIPLVRAKAICYRRLPFFIYHALVVSLFKVVPHNVSFYRFGRDPIYQRYSLCVRRVQRRSMRKEMPRLVSYDSL